MSYHTLSCRDLGKEMLWVFSEYEGDNFVMRPEYRHLQCPSCGQLDCLEALKCGISKRFRGPKSRRDAADSNDSQLIVSIKCIDVLNSVASGLFYAFDIPNDERYKIIYPKQIIYPPNDLPITKKVSYRSGEAFHNYKGICSECSKYKEVTMFDKNYMVPNGIQLAAVEIGRKIPILSWIANDEIKDALSQGLIGWWIRKNAFANSQEMPGINKKRK